MLTPGGVADRPEDRPGGDLRGSTTMSDRTALPSDLPADEFPGDTRSASAVRRSIRVLTVRVDGHDVRYSSGGSGPTVLFLHGWGLGHNAYRPGLRRLAEAGLSVVAPALPGFGGTPELPAAQQNFAGYAAWVIRFMQALRIRHATVVGHSFGGGVAIQTAESQPAMVRSLVLLNSVGAPWRAKKTRDQPMAERPFWSWGINIPSDVVALLGHIGSAMPSVLEDLVPNVVRNPLGVARVGKIARQADLVEALVEVRRRNVPITIVHSLDDGVIPRSSFECLCRAASVNGIVVTGNHSWPMTDPEKFREIVTRAALRSSHASVA
jgi:pimeloyl-ACP methyl ester carboxylesterase